MSVQVYIPTPFRRATNNKDRLSVDAHDVRTLLDESGVVNTLLDESSSRSLAGRHTRMGESRLESHGFGSHIKIIECNSASAYKLAIPHIANRVPTRVV